MGTIEKTVFISYRRDDVPWALAVYQNLSAHGYDVFFDYNSIHSGDFEQIIVGNIRARAHFVLILTPSALERCHEPGDWLRREIEAALGEKRNIIPLFFDGFNFGDPSVSGMLTGELAALKRYNGFNVYTDYFDSAMQKLRDQFLNVELDAVLHPLSQEAQKEVQAQKEAADRALQGDAPAPAAPEKKEEDTLFELGIRAELMGELEKALNYYYNVRRIDPLYPRIDRKIEDLETELRKAARPPAQAAPPGPPQRNPLMRLALVGILAVVGACGVTLSYLGVRTAIAPSQATQALATSVPIISPPAPGTTATATFVEPPETTSGPWVGQTGRLEISVEQVEAISRVGDRKILRFYLSVDNRTGDAITLPLFSNFLAIDSSGQSYTADHELRNWPRTFPAGERVTGSIDLKDPVPEGVSSLKINFSTIFGALEMVGKSITVTDISVP
jgi:hypothetical protein